MRRTGLWAAWIGIVAAGCVAAWSQVPVQTPAAAPGAATLHRLTPQRRRLQPLRCSPIRPRRFKLRPSSPAGKTARHGEERQHSSARRNGNRAKHATGKRYSTTTDITGAWSLNVPPNGRYVIRTQFAAFAAGSQEAVLNAASHDQTVTFRIDTGFAGGGAAEERVRRVSRRASRHPATGRKRRAKSEPEERAGSRYRDARRRCPARQAPVERSCPPSPATPTLARIRWPSAGSRER